MTEYFVKPWVGDRYESPSIFPHRTLIVGESNYVDSPEKFNPYIVINCVADDLSGDDPTGFGKFSTKLRRVIFGSDGDMGPHGFWPNVAFYNFVQYLVGDAARQRPTNEMWKSSVPAFERVVEDLKPERILVLGLENWRNLLACMNHTPVSRHQAVLKVGSRDVVAGYIQHPSSSMSYAEWGPVARSLLLNGT